MAISRASTSTLRSGFARYQSIQDKSYFAGPAGVSSVGLHSWYDASDASTITSSSGNVSQWNDKSPNGRHAIKSGSGFPKTGLTTLNGKNVIEFNGVDQFLLAPASVTSNNLTFFSVYRRLTGGPAYARVLSLWRTSLNDYAYTDSFLVHASAVTFQGNTVPVIGSYRNSAPITESSISYGTTYLLSATLNNDTVVLNNSGTVRTGTTSTTSLNSNNLTLGAGGPDGGGDQFFNGYYAEHILFTRVLSSEEISEVRSYLSTKWGVS